MLTNWRIALKLRPVAVRTATGRVVEATGRKFCCERFKIPAGLLMAKNESKQLEIFYFYHG